MYGMDDEGLFEQLFKLLQTPGPVNWKLAREVTKSLAGTPTPVEPGVAEEYMELACLGRAQSDRPGDLGC